MCIVPSCAGISDFYFTFSYGTRAQLAPLRQYTRKSSQHTCVAAAAVTDGDRNAPQRGVETRPTALLQSSIVTRGPLLPRRCRRERRVASSLSPSTSRSDTTPGAPSSEAPHGKCHGAARRKKTPGHGSARCRTPVCLRVRVAARSHRDPSPMNESAPPRRDALLAPCAAAGHHFCRWRQK